METRFCNTAVRENESNESSGVSFFIFLLLLLLLRLVTKAALYLFSNTNNYKQHLGIKKQHIFDLGLAALYLLELTLRDCLRAISGKQLYNKLKFTCDYKDTLLNSTRSVRASAKNPVSVLPIIKSLSLNFPHNYVPGTWNLE